MAQQRTSGTRRLGWYLRRMGLGGTGKRPVALALVATMGLCAGAGALGLARSGGFVVERAGEAEGATAADDGNVDGSPGSASEGSASSESIVVMDPEAPQRCIVHVDGAVAAPGVYELEGSDLRLNDAVEAAGGLLPGADTSALNLAAPLTDGAKVHVPKEGEVAVGGEASSGVAGAADGAEALININTATVEELCTLPGVGEATATAIVEERTRNGPFTMPEDLMRVSGIGEKKFARVKDLICV